MKWKLGADNYLLSIVSIGFGPYLLALGKERGIREDTGDFCRGEGWGLKKMEATGDYRRTQTSTLRPKPQLSPKPYTLDITS